MHKFLPLLLTVITYAQTVRITPEFNYEYASDNESYIIEGLESQDYEFTFIGEFKKDKLNILTRMGYHFIDGMIGYPSDFTRLQGLHWVEHPPGIGDDQRNYNVEGPDPMAPWFSLGENTGLPDLECSDGECRYYWIDTDVYNGLEYTYSVTSYDMGVPYPEANPDEWARPDGYRFIESPRGTTRLDDNYVTVIAGKPAEFNECDDVIVVPNPYIARSGLDESTYERRIQFQNVPSEYALKIYTVSGELVWEQDETYGDYDGFAFWNLRTVNNQEVAPGLYYYTISNDDCKGMGKISIIR